MEGVRSPKTREEDREGAADALVPRTPEREGPVGYVGDMDLNMGYDPNVAEEHGYQPLEELYGEVRATASRLMVPCEYSNGYYFRALLDETVGPPQRPVHTCRPWLRIALSTSV